MLGLVAVAVAVAGVSAGAHEILADPPRPVPPPATSVPSPSPSPSPSASTPPTPEPTGSPVVRRGCDEVLVYPYNGPSPAGPALPAGLMLRAADFGRCFAQTADEPGYLVPDRTRAETAPLDLCLAADYPADGKRTAGRLREFAGGPEVPGGR